MKLSEAARLNAGPVIPGAAARATVAHSSAAAAVRKERKRPVDIAVFVVLEVMAALPTT